MSSDSGTEERSDVATAPGAVLGACPGCGEAIPRTRLLIEYETGSGRSRYAECPACLDVVHPRTCDDDRTQPESDSTASDPRS